MRIPALLGLGSALLLASTASAAPILVNEFNAVSAANFLSGTAADSTLGRVVGNGGDWVELVVIQDHLDLRGGSLSINEGNVPQTTTVLTFTQNSLWSDLRSGTIITVAEDIADDTSYNPTNGLGQDWWINVQATTGGPTQLITASNFSVSNDNTQITLLDALNQIWFGPAGEGVVPATGVGSNEVWKLEANPSAAITPLSNYMDGSSSSFGAPNIWNSGANTQDFSLLRAVVAPEPIAATLVGVVVGAFLIFRARRAA